MLARLDIKPSGVEHLSTYMKVYKVGDIVDVKVGFCLEVFSFRCEVLTHLIG